MHIFRRVCLREQAPSWQKPGDKDMLFVAVYKLFLCDHNIITGEQPLCEGNCAAGLEVQRTV